MAAKVRAREFGADLLAGISLMTSLLLGQYLVGAIVVLMLTGGTASASIWPVHFWCQLRLMEPPHSGGGFVSRSPA